MIKIPGTRAGLSAIISAIAAGINVNLTLLFSVERYAEVIEAFLTGLERRLERGLPVASIASVASFFVSRVDGKVDPLLDRIDGAPLRGKAAIANACMAYSLFERSLAHPLVAPRTVNTLPPETLEAYRDHGNPAVRVQNGVAAAPEQLEALARAGIDLAQVTRELEEEGVEKFAASYRSLLAAIEAKIGQLV